MAGPGLLGWGLVRSALAAPVPDPPDPPEAPSLVTSALLACCQQSGVAACPTEIAAVGPGSRTIPNPSGAGGMEVTGLWALRCEGDTAFQSDRRLLVGGKPTDGSVLGAIEPAAAACFDRTCALPVGLCIRTSPDGAGSKLRVVGCEDGLVPTEALWHNPARTLAPPQRPPMISPVASTNARSLDTSLPERPSLPCTTQGAGEGIAVRTRIEQSNQQVDLGNDAMIAGDLATALDRYRAALSLNRCNVNAWAALSEALSQAPGAAREGWLVPARLAFETATLLMPTHFHAWTRLGEASEQLGDRSGAALAFRRALEQKPGHPPATAGLARLQEPGPGGGAR